MRIAWIGPVSSSGGVASMGRVYLAGLLRLGVEVDFYTIMTRDELPEDVKSRANLQVVGSGIGWHWKWGSWYNRKPFMAFVSSALFRIHEYNLLSRLLIENHHTRKYDCIFQFSQQELFRLGRYRHELPPIVVHPCAHAAGELRWHRRESRYAREYENSLIHYGVRASLLYRSWVQRRELRKPAVIIGPSNRFNKLLMQDYGVAEGRLAVLRHPLLLQPPSTITASSLEMTGPIQLAAVMRVSSRKGVEQIIELSHRLKDLKGQVQITIIGGYSLWSDYRPHLSKLNPDIAVYVGQLSFDKMIEAYDRADALLVPSMYEPGSLAVGEAMSRGCTIIASDEVGPAEVLPLCSGIVFSAGNMDEFESSVRAFIERIKPDRTSIRQKNIAEASRLFGPDKILGDFIDILQKTIDRRLPVQPANK